MNTSNFVTNFSSPIEEQIQVELNNYKQALKADEEFYVLKSIREKIKILEDRLRQRQQNFRVYINNRN